MTIRCGLSCVILLGSVGGVGCAVDVGELDSSTLGREQGAMVGDPKRFWCNTLSSDKVQCADPVGSPPLVSACWDAPYAYSTYAAVRAEIMDELSMSYERYARFNLIWKGGGNGSAAKCTSSDPGVHFALNVDDHSGGHSQMKTLVSDVYQGSVTTPDCGMVSTYEPAQSWVTEEQCVRGVLLHEFGHELGFHHDDTSPQSNEPADSLDCNPSSTDYSWHSWWQNYGSNGTHTHMDRMNTCGGLTEDESAYWSQYDLFPTEIASIQRAYGRRVDGSLLTPHAMCAASHADASGDTAFLWDCDEAGHDQEWRWLPQTGADGSLQVNNTNLCLRASPTGDQATATTCAPASAYQRFQLTKMMIRGFGGLCLYLNGGDTNGGGLQARTCDGSDDRMRWTIWHDSTDDAYSVHIRYGDGSSSKCVQMGDNPTDQNTVVSCADTPRQRLYMGGASINDSRGYCMDVFSTSDADYLAGAVNAYPISGSRVQAYPCIMQQLNQKWNLNGPITQPVSGKCLRRSDGSTAGASVFVSTCTASTGGGWSDWDYYMLGK